MQKYDDIVQDYIPDNTIWSEEDEKLNKVKNIIFNELTEVERRIIIMYAELGSLRKLGKELGVSASSAFIKIRQIKEKINDKYNT